MTVEIERVFTRKEGRLIRENEYDLTLGLQIPFSGKDWCLENARLVINQIDDSAQFHMVLGLRGSFLQPFERVLDFPDSRYMTCDIFGLVPITALVASNQDNGLSAGALERRESGTFVILAFEGRVTRKRSWEKDLARNVMRFMQRLDNFATILERTIHKDPVIGHWSIDWREFLAGETGFVNMSWFPTLTTKERSQALDSVTVAAKALIQSVLSSEEMQDPIVRGLIDWLNNLCPAVEVVRYEGYLPEVV